MGVVLTLALKKLLCFYMRRLLYALFVIICFVASTANHAGFLAFELTQTGNNLVLRNIGNEAAFFPVVFSVANDGQWQNLCRENIAFLPAGASFILDQPSPKNRRFNFNIYLLTFLDKAGTQFWKMAFLPMPQIVTSPLNISHLNGRLLIAPRANPDILASWVFVTPKVLHDSLVKSFQVPVLPQNPVVIDWIKSKNSYFEILGQPEQVYLVHETNHGYQLQTYSRQQNQSFVINGWPKWSHLLNWGAVIFFSAWLYLLLATRRKSA